MNSEIERKNMKKTFTEKLFAPSVPVESREERRRMEFLLKLLLAVMAVIVWFMLMLTVFIGPAAAIKDLDFILSLIAFIMAITAFRLAKFGHVKLSSYFIVISFTLIIYLMSLLNLMGYSTMYDKNDLNILLFLFFPILFTISLLDIKKAVVVITIDMVAILLLPVFLAHIAFIDLLFGPFFLLMMVSIFLLIYNHHQIKVKKDRIKDLEDRDEKLRSMLLSSPDGIILTEIDTTIINCNKAVVDMLGYDSKNELTGMDVFSFISPAEMSKATTNYKKTMEEGKARNVEYNLIRKDGSMFPAIVSFSVIKDKNGDPKALISTIKDVSRQREVQRWESLLDTILRTDIMRGDQLINGYLELLKESELDSIQEDMVKRALSSSKAQIRLIKKIDILRNLGKEYSRGKVNPYFLLEESIDLYRSKLEEKGIDLVTDIEETEIKVVSEGRGGVLLETIFNNLLDSVVDHSGADTLEIKTGETEGFVNMSFIDNGTMENREGVSDIMHGHMARNKMSKFGLSLFLVKNIVETFGGGIEFNRSSIGRVRFDVYLKKA